MCLKVSTGLAEIKPLRGSKNGYKITSTQKALSPFDAIV